MASGFIGRSWSGWIMRSVSVAPGAGDFTPDQLQVLLPGDAVGPWRLLAIDGNAAVFQIDGQVRRLAIP